MRRALQYVVFVLVFPALGGLYLPWLILTESGATFEPAGWPAAMLIGIGVAIDAWCFQVFWTTGRGTPSIWDPPRRVVAVGPYRWVRNPIYVGALLIVGGEAWLFLSLPLLGYVVVLAIGFHLLVVAYEEPRLEERFGADYAGYRRSVGRWIPRPPR
jgi:protein-S-isoprenylcysteine O-methyltransferase Ste14